MNFTEEDLKGMTDSEKNKIILELQRFSQVQKLHGAMDLIKEVACIEENNGGEDIADKLAPIFQTEHDPDTPIIQLALAVYEVYEEYVQDIEE